MSEPSRDQRYLEYMLESIRDVQSYASRGRAHFLGNRQLRDAIYWRLQTTADASRRVSERVRAEHPEVAWRELHAFRNVMVHDFLTISPRRIWDLVSERLPELKSQVQRMLSEIA